MAFDDLPQSLPEGVTRRRMLKLTGSAAAASSVAASTATAKGRKQEIEKELDDTTLIDSHLHITPIDGTTRNAFSAEQAKTWMNKNGVDKAVLLPLESPTSWFFPVPTWWMLEEAQKFPNRFIPFCSVAPQVADQFGDGTVRERIEMYVEMGAQGVGELKAPMPFNDERAQLVYEVCADLDLPIIFHIDGVNLTDEVGLPNTEEMLQSYPDVDFIGHGAGWWASISGDIDEVGTVWPSGPVEPGGAVPRLLDEYDNIYGELSAGSGWNAITRDPEFGQSFLEEHHEQLIFGTDKLAPEQSVDNFDLFSEFDLEPDQWEDIRYRNFQKVL